MSKPHNKAVYAIADTLMMTIKANHKTGELVGEADHDLYLGDGFVLPASIKLKSSMNTTKASFALVHVHGNLGLLIAAGEKGSPIYLFVLNLAKMDSMTGWFAKHSPTNSTAAASLLADAVVAKYEEKNGSWRSLKE